MDDLILIFQEPDVPAEEEMLAPCAEAHLVQRPPLLEWVMGLQELQLAPEGGDERVQQAVGVVAFFSHWKNQTPSTHAVQRVSADGATIRF